MEVSQCTTIVEGAFARGTRFNVTSSVRVDPPTCSTCRCIRHEVYCPDPSSESLWEEMHTRRVDGSSSQSYSVMESDPCYMHSDDLPKVLKSGHFTQTSSPRLSNLRNDDDGGKSSTLVGNPSLSVPGPAV